MCANGQGGISVRRPITELKTIEQKLCRVRETNQHSPYHEKKFYLCALLLAASTITSLAQVSQWIAYNDHYRGAGTGPNVSSWNILNVTGGAPGNSGPMTNSATGAVLPVTMSVTSAVAGVTGGTTSAGPAAGTPAALLFAGQIDFGSGTLGHALQLVTTAKIVHSFSGLDPSRQYSWHGTAARGGNYADRWALVEIGAAAFTDAHTLMATGVFVTAQIPGLTAAQAVINSGENRAPGALVGWTNITPNADGTIHIYQSSYRGTLPSPFVSTGTYGYAMVADRLEEFTVVNVVTCVGITNQSGNISVAERGLATFSISATGTPQNIQWYRSNNGGASYSPIGGATASTYSIPSAASPGDNGAKFYAVVTNTSCNVTSTPVTLTVIPDTVRPVAIRAVASTNQTTITVSFSEALAPASVTASAFNVYLTSGAPGAAVVAATLANSTNVILIVTNAPLAAGQNYSVRITGVTDTANTPNLLNPNPTVLPINQTVVVFNFTKTWRYNQTGADLGTTWKETSYDDSAWPSGPGVLGFETTPATLMFLTNISPPNATNTVLTLQNGVGGGLGGTNVTFYFRTAVNIANFNPASATMTLRGYIDDGAALYINGVERFRYNLPAAATYTTFASANLAEAVLVVSNLTGFVQGNNVIAVEVHQDAVASSDIDWGMQLEALVASFTPAGPRLVTSSTGGNNFTITWSGGGTLQKSADIGSPANWVNIPGAASPFVTNTIGAKQFFRVTVP